MGCPACGASEHVEASDGRLCCASCGEVLREVQLVDDTDTLHGVFQPVNEHLGLGAAAEYGFLQKRRLFPEKDAAVNARSGTVRRGVEDVCSAARMPRGTGADSACGEVVDLVNRYFKSCTNERKFYVMKPGRLAPIAAAACYVVAQKRSLALTVIDLVKSTRAALNPLLQTIKRMRRNSIATDYCTLRVQPVMDRLNEATNVPAAQRQRVSTLATELAELAEERATRRWAGLDPERIAQYNFKGEIRIVYSIGAAFHLATEALGIPSLDTSASRVLQVSEVTLRKHRVELEEELVDLGQALPWGPRLRDVFDFNFINFIPARVPFLLEHRAALRALAEANPAQKTKRAPGTNFFKLAPEKKMPQALTRDKVLPDGEQGAFRPARRKAGAATQDRPAKRAKRAKLVGGQTADCEPAPQPAERASTGAAKKAARGGKQPASQPAATPRDDQPASCPTPEEISTTSTTTTITTTITTTTTTTTTRCAAAARWPIVQRTEQRTVQLGSKPCSELCRQMCGEVCIMNCG